MLNFWQLITPPFRIRIKISLKPLYNHRPPIIKDSPQTEIVTSCWQSSTTSPAPVSSSHRRRGWWDHHFLHRQPSGCPGGSRENDQPSPPREPGCCIPLATVDMSPPMKDGRRCHHTHRQQPAGLRSESKWFQKHYLSRKEKVLSIVFVFVWNDRHLDIECCNKHKKDMFRIFTSHHQQHFF